MASSRIPMINDNTSIRKIPTSDQENKKKKRGKPTTSIAKKNEGTVTPTWAHLEYLRTSEEAHGKDQKGKKKQSLALDKKKDTKNPVRGQKREKPSLIKDTSAKKRN